ncbi:hypothetical protein GLW04_19485 [Halobacillus litoralis]|uniref:Uncharacterized protein n=1 Tax=Halobacillus litoralis TaxID=45668 RepID=A0A845DWL6_9BACI|nr:hypothetical protein [Halobacillus litoralis]MYL22061.1 hypothetical protein [Halobacillus litoralis]
MDVVTKFYQALNKLDIKYDEETGRLSKPIVFVVYDSSRKIQAKRLFILKNYFLILREEENDTRKIQFKHIKGFQYVDKSEIIT